MRRAQFDEASQPVRNLALYPRFEYSDVPTTLRTNLAPNPSFEGVSGTPTVRTNLCTNPSMESAGAATALRTNLALNPSMETASGVVTTRTNLCINPNLEANSTGYNAANEATVTQVASAAMSGAFVGRITYTGTSLLDSGLGFAGAFAPIASTTYTVSMDLLSSVSRSVRFSAQGTGTVNQGSAAIPLTAGVVQRVSWTFATSATAPTQVALYLLRSDYLTGTVDFDRVLIEQSTTALSYFDGATVAAGDYTYAWSATANTSPSLQKAPGVVGWSAALSTVKPVQSVTTKSHRTASLMVLGGPDGNRTAQSTYTASAGKLYTISADMQHNAGATRELRLDYTFQDSVGTRIGSYVAGPTVLVAGGSWNRIATTTITAPANTATITVYAAMIGGISTETYWVDAFMLEETSTSLPYFDGASSTSGDFTYAWSGTANASASEQRGLPVSGRGALAPSSIAWQSGVRSRSGAKSAAVQTRYPVTDGTIWLPPDYIIGSTVNASTAYTWSMYVWVPSGSSAVKLMDITSGTSGTASTLYDQWERISLTTTTLASGNLVLRLRSVVTMPAGVTIWIDDELFEAAPVALEYFDGTNPIQNLATDPKPTTLAIPTNGAGWNTNRWFGASGAGTYTIISNATDGPTYSLNAYVRKAWTVGWSAGDTGFNNTAAGLPIIGGTTYTVSSYLRSSAAGKTNANICLTWKDSVGTTIGSTVTGPQQTLTAGVWSRVYCTATAPANATTLGIWSDQDGGTAWVAGDTLDGTGLMIEKSATLNPYYSGIGDYTYAWNGTANASTSLQRGVGVNSVTISTGLATVSSPSLSSTGKALRMIPTTMTTDTYVQLALASALVTGKTYTVSATLNITAPQTGTLDTRGRKVVAYQSGQQNNGTQAPNVAGSFRSSVTFTVTDAAQYQSVRLYNGASAGNGDAWWDDVLIEEVSTVMPYFDGTTVAAGDFTYAWSGTAHASSSLQRANGLPYLQTNKGGGSFFGYQSTAEDGKKIARWVAPAGTASSVWRVAGMASGGITGGWDYSAVKAGGRYTLMMRYRSSGWGAGQAFQTMIADAGATNQVAAYEGVQPLNTGWVEYRRTFTALRDATASSIIYISLPTVPQSSTDGVLEMREWMLVEGEYTGDFIAGSNPLSKWQGTANRSTSIGYPPQLFDIAGKPDADITTTGLVVLPGGVDPTSPRTLYTVTYLFNDIPTAGIDGIVAYGDSALNDTLSNNYMTLRYQSEPGATSTLLNRRTGGGGPQVGGVPVGVNVVCWGMRNQNLFVSHGGRTEVVDSGNVMSVDHEAISISGSSSQRMHIRTLVYLADHDAATKLAIQRYLGNKYGGSVA